MKIKISIIAIYLAGIALAMAQSNPASTSAVDAETELSWPNGTVYVNSINANDSFDSIYGTGFDNFSWNEASGGAVVGSDYNYTHLPSGIWPESLETFGIEGDPWGIDTYGMLFLAIDNYWPIYFGSTSGASADGFAWDYNDQAELIMLTGGAPGTTGSELCQITGAAISIGFSNDYLYSNVPPQNIQVSSLGSLNANHVLWAVVPLHSKIVVTPNTTKYHVGAISSAGFFQLVSQCVATTPTNQARTTIGVGEQVNLSFNPSLPTNVTAIWSTTAGSLSNTNAPSTQFTAPDFATNNVKVTAMVGGAPERITFNVVAPNGTVTAEITGTNHYSEGIMGAGMSDKVWLQPTNVSFYRVFLVELPCVATNITGYFTNMSVPAPNVGSAQVAQDNSFNDSVLAYFTSYGLPLYPGGFEFDIPVEWQITGSSTTNNLGIFVSPASLLDSAGDFSISKYGITITRSLDDVSYSNQ